MAEQAAVASAAVAEQAVVASAAVAVFTAEALTAVATMAEDMALVAIAVAGVRRMAVAAPTVGWGAAHPRAVLEEARPPVVETRAVGPDGVPAATRVAPLRTADGIRSEAVAVGSDQP